MKCTPIKLQSRSELCRNKVETHITKEPAYITKECNWYSFTFTRQASSSSRTTNLSVKDLKLPDNTISYNSGYSLEKWSKKRPRLKSSKHKSDVNTYTDFLDDDNNCDIDTIINSLENSEETPKVEPETEYEVNSDIEELFRKSQTYEESEKHRRDYSTSKKKLKRKLRKTIKFSFSKPASPETEQVIRVDVTSNISLDELKQLEINKDDLKMRQSKLGKVEKNNSAVDKEEQECIIRCSQLALTPKR